MDSRMRNVDPKIVSSDGKKTNERRRNVPWPRAFGRKYLTDTSITLVLNIGDK